MPERKSLRGRRKHSLLPDRASRNFESHFGPTTRWANSRESERDRADALGRDEVVGSWPRFFGAPLPPASATTPDIRVEPGVPQRPDRRSRSPSSSAVACELNSGRRIRCQYHCNKLYISNTNTT